MYKVRVFLKSGASFDFETSKIDVWKSGGVIDKLQWNRVNGNGPLYIDVDQISALIQLSNREEV